MTRVAFVTCAGLPDLVDDDVLTARALGDRGVIVEPAIWDAPGVDWTSYSAVVIRSAWDYHRHVARYAEWLRARAGDGTRLWNPASSVLANLHKGYLDAFARGGVPIVPTAFVASGAEQALGDVLASLACAEAVVKPAVSANASGTWLASLAHVERDQQRFADQVRAEDLLVQPYLPEIAAEGEWSMVFFGSGYSHAVLKRPAAGEFRVQEHLGGDAIAAEPPPALVEQARAALAAAGAPLLYARVDGIRRGDRFLLMELEINEPTLFLGYSPGAAEQFADAVKGVLHA